MTPHENESRFAVEIARMKKLTIETNRRDRHWFLATAVAGLLGSVAAWFALLREPDRTFGEKIPFSAVVGIIVSVIVFVIGRVSTDHKRPVSNCPRCSYCWGVAEYEDEWLKWKCCPSCGLKVNDDADAEERL